MPYLIIADKQHELDRHELTGPAVVGRSPQCDVVVRDVLLSRRHCEFREENGQWIVVDLGSKNGTFVDHTRIERRTLDDADVIRAGRTRIVFRSGKFIPPPPDVIERKAARRPADPIEALSGTMVGFVMTDMEENARVTGFPIPRPKAPDAESEAAQDELMRPPGTGEPWDLSLRDPTPPPGSAVPQVKPAAEVLRREKALRKSPQGESDSATRARRGTRAAKPETLAVAPQWLAALVALLVYLLCALVLWLLAWPR